MGNTVYLSDIRTFKTSASSLRIELKFSTRCPSLRHFFESILIYSVFRGKLYSYHPPPPQKIKKLKKMSEVAYTGASQ